MEAAEEVLKEPERKNAQYWAREIEQSSKMLRDFHKQGSKIVGRYLDDRPQYSDKDRNQLFRLNFFHRNVKLQQSIMYNNLPSIDVARENDDFNDDVARVAGDIMERLLNLDLQNHAEETDTVLKNVLQDRLLPGLGVARVRYEVETEEVTVAEVVAPSGVMIAESYTETRVVSEDAPIDYYFWKDVLWGWCRGWADMPWLGFRAYMTKDEAAERFGEDKANQLQYKKQKAGEEADEVSKRDEDDWTQKAQIWEIWDKEDRCVYWYSKGAGVLEKKDDPLGLNGFYPAPPFFIANPTTTLYKPTADFHLAQDLYNEVDVLQTRISLITDAVKVVGVYDSSAEGVQRMLKEGFENDLIPVDNWAMFAEKGGLRGQVDWMPIETIANVLDRLVQQRNSTISLLQNVTGMADVMQGQLQNQYEGVGQTQIKAQFGSANIQTLQEEFATFVTDLMQIKAEVICKHYSPETIVKQSNVMYSVNRDLAPQAVQLLKQPDMAHMRIKVRSETMAMIDYAKLQQERTGFLTALATFLQSAAPLVQAEPGSTPFLLEMLQWTMAGYKGSNEIEATLDKMVTQAQQPKPEQPNPEAQREQARQQGDMQKIQAKAQADAQTRQVDMQADIATENNRHRNKMNEIAAQAQVKASEHQIKGEIDAFLKNLETRGDLEQIDRSAAAEIRKKWNETVIEVEKMEAQTVQSIEQKAAEAMIDTELHFATQDEPDGGP